MMKSSRGVKIVVSALILTVIGGIWIIKNAGQKPVDDSTTSQNNTGLSDRLEGADFCLRETEAINFETLSAYGLPIIVDYGADSCIPCKQMAPVLEKANKEFHGKAFVKFINVWDFPDAAKNVPIRVIPAQVLFNAYGKPFVPSGELANKMRFDNHFDRDTGEHIFTVHQGGLTEDQMWEILKEMRVEK